MSTPLNAEEAADLAARYPTLTPSERDVVGVAERGIAYLDAQIEELQAQRQILREQRSHVFDQAALRDATPAEVVQSVRTTGRGKADLDAIVRDMHPYLDDVWITGPFEQAHRPLAAYLRLTGDRNDPEQVEPLAAALLVAVRLIAPDGGLSIDTEKVPHALVDWTWIEHAQGMHPVDIIEDDLGETRSLLLAHSADGTRAVLLNQRGYASGGPVVASGTLVEVLTETFRIVREDQPTRDDDYGRW